jgi:hypothetical protein
MSELYFLVMKKGFQAVKQVNVLGKSTFTSGGNVPAKIWVLKVLIYMVEPNTLQ